MQNCVSWYRMGGLPSSTVSSFTPLTGIRSGVWEKSQTSASALKQWAHRGAASHLWGARPDAQLAFLWCNWLAGPGGIYIRPLLPPCHSASRDKKEGVHVRVVRGWSHLLCFFFLFSHHGGKLPSRSISFFIWNARLRRKEGRDYRFNYACVFSHSL